MDVMSRSYLFESPYHSRVQFGREDTSAKQNEQMQQESASLTQNSNETVQQAQTVQASQENEVTPRVNENALLDTYA
jgi:hypothetical protein